MKQRKPGDYVVNAELTDEQRERFVKDCLKSGAKGIADKYQGVYSGWHCVSEKLVGASKLPLNENNCTHEYKDNPMTQADLMRQIADAMERNPDGWWREFEVYWFEWEPVKSPEDVFGVLKANASRLRPKPRTYTLHIEDMPEPMREEPEYGSDYYFVMPVLSSKTFWSGGEGDRHLLEHGACYPDKKSAQQAMDKLKAAMGVRDE